MRGLNATIAIGLALGLAAPIGSLPGVGDAAAQPKKPTASKPAKPAKPAPPPDAKGDQAPEPDDARARGKVKERRGGKERLFDFTGLELAGSMRMPQLLYFLERAQDELERASLKRRSFIPEMVRSLDEDAL